MIMSESTMRNTAQDPIVTLIPSTTNPLRRGSMGLQASAISALPENNDEVERRERRDEISLTTQTPKESGNNTRRVSLGLGFLAQMTVPQVTERITQCIKLNAANKISIKNAFSLEIIDFMTYMIKKQDSNISSLQVAGTTLGVSTKIYGFRVDGIYNEILKLIGGADMQQEEDISKELQTFDSIEGNQEDGTHKSRRKKRKKNRQQIITSHSALKGNIEISKPSLVMMRQEAQTTDLLSQAMLPNHATTRYHLHAHNDIIVDSVDHIEIPDKSAGSLIPSIENFSDLDICPPLSTFEFHNWSEDSEYSNTEVEKANDEFQFDLEASLPHDDEPPTYNMNYLDIDTEDENMDTPQEQLKEVHKIEDLRDVVTVATSDKRSEYSFIQKGLNMHWAGPSHWKAHNLRRILGNSNSNIVETCQQGKARKRKNIEMAYSTEKVEAIKMKFVQGQAIKLQSRAAKVDWYEDRTLLPIDMHYHIASANKLYLHRLFSIRSQVDDLNTTHLSGDIDRYDYNNENDVSNYCPNAVRDDYDSDDENNDLHQDPQVCLTGQNLVTAPKLANKISIAYSARPKRIDMRQLKKSIWKYLLSCSDKENISIQEAVEEAQLNQMKEEKRFSDVSKALPNILTKANAEALSFPISFVSLLHLANEKSLKINTLPDMSDLIVSAN